MGLEKNRSYFRFPIAGNQVVLKLARSSRACRERIPP
jgi:hypothetical protein